MICSAHLIATNSLAIVSKKARTHFGELRVVRASNSQSKIRRSRFSVNIDRTGSCWKFLETAHDESDSDESDHTAPTANSSVRLDSDSNMPPKKRRACLCLSLSRKQGPDPMDLAPLRLNESLRRAARSELQYYLPTQLLPSSTYFVYRKGRRRVGYIER